MGGLLARVYSPRYRPQRLGRVVMLGTPNGGSEIADRLKNIAAYRAFFGPAGQQLGTQRDAAIEALFPPVDYPVGIIAGNRSIDPMARQCCRSRMTDGCRWRTPGSTAWRTMSSSARRIRGWCGMQLRSRRRLRFCGMGDLNLPTVITREGG